MRDALIVEAVRTPMGKRGGALSTLRAEELAAAPLSAIVRRTGIDPGEVEDVALGCVTQVGEQGFCVGRVAALVAGFPASVPGTSINRMCASSLQAYAYASHTVMAGMGDLLIAGGVESMSRVAMGSDGGAPPQAVLERFELVPQGVSAELVAERYGITRERMDRFSLESHRRAVAAAEGGGFSGEIEPVEAPGPDGEAVRVERDEGPRPDTSYDRIAGLNPAFSKDGSVTAGNSSQITDGAAALLVASAERAEALGLKPRARYVASAAVGVDVTMMLDGPIPATRRVLDRAGLTLGDIDVFEVNEAFACVPLAWQDALSVDPERVNLHGGAIALGHPLGASGARLVVTLLHLLEQRQARYGLAVLCIGYGQAVATIIERV